MQDEEQIKSLVFKQYKLLQKAKALEWGYKVLDAANPRKSMMPTGVTKVRPSTICIHPYARAVWRQRTAQRQRRRSSAAQRSAALVCPAEYTAVPSTR